MNHDPYLQTVKITLEDKKYKELYNKKKEKKKLESFMRKEIHLTDYINLSKEAINILGLLTFMILPYLVGITFIFFVIAKANSNIFGEISVKYNQYLVSWAIGYEIIATFLLLWIIKSAISFSFEKR